VRAEDRNFEDRIPCGLMGDTTPRTALTLTTDDGVRIEAELRVPTTPIAATVMCHPHPQHGGNMRSLVPSVLFDALPAAGIAALRFNFRGVEGSTGTFGGAVDEQRDLVAAIDRLDEAVPGVPTVAVGWSFGAEVAAAVVDSRLAAWVLVAAPLRILPADAHRAGADPRPKLILQPEHDQFRTPDSLRDHIAEWVNTTLEVIAGADHFLVGRTDRVAARTTSFISSLESEAPRSWTRW
jgi:alpha/beta superfamily hydrolase